jgi:hypothetical protein
MITALAATTYDLFEGLRSGIEKTKWHHPAPWANNEKAAMPRSFAHSGPPMYQFFL